MSGRRSRRKGSAFEREIANALKPYFPKARRGIGQARSGGEVCDVEGTPYWIETKRHKRCSIPAAWRQACEATDGRPCLVISKDDGGPVLVVHDHNLVPDSSPILVWDRSSAQTAWESVGQVGKVVWLQSDLFVTDLETFCQHLKKYNDSQKS